MDFSVILGSRRPGCPSTQQVCGPVCLTRLFVLPRAGYQGGLVWLVPGQPRITSVQGARAMPDGRSPPSEAFARSHDDVARSAGISLPAASARAAGCRRRRTSPALLARRPRNRGRRDDRVGPEREDVVAIDPHPPPLAVRASHGAALAAHPPAA